uniref:Pleckstrin homology domain containing, family A member 7b n=1 Tax=Astatotilapia calliptera TaxID=8154 RepID=A0AAX7V300_ASTCA
MWAPWKKSAERERGDEPSWSREIMAAPLGRDTLPDYWSYGVCRDGRVFFISDKTQSTTWLHPRTGEPVNSGHMIRSDLPRGWEEGFTEEGASYFINHNLKATSFRHPVTGQISPENIDYTLQDRIESRMSKSAANQRSANMVTESSKAVTSAAVDASSGSKVSTGKVHNFGKRDHAIKRNLNIPVVVRGWLYKQDSSGMRLWKRKWFVLSDYCLFYYKGKRTNSALGEGHTGMRAYIYNKNSVIGSQAEHCGMRTYFFSADTQEDMNGWIRAMNQAALMQQSHMIKRLVSLYWVQLVGPKSSAADVTYQSLPKSPRLPCGSSSPPATCNLPSDYKYAHDRLSHFRMSTDERMATKEGMVWQLYEWQQRQQFRHGSPTAPIYTGPNFTDSSSFRVTVEMPRSISVPPSPCEVPPSSFKPLSPRRPHTPSDRRTVRPLDELAPGDSTRSSSPGHFCNSQIERRSVPAMGYITHTVSAPSLHGKTADDTYIQLKKDLEYLDLKVGPNKVKLSRLCEQDKILQELEARIRTLKEDKDKLESVLDVSHQQMEDYRDQPAHAEKIAYQQKLLQEDVVHIRAEISQVSTEMENAWNEYSQLERDVDWLKSALQGQMSRCDLSQQEKVQIRKELWRIEDVIAGLSSSKANYKVTISSVTNPERKFVPSVSVSSVPSVSGSASAMEMRLSQQQQQHSPHLSPSNVPPRPPLPQLYSPDEHPPAVPPLPRETTVIRHTSVRGLKRQSDERKRDRETGQYTNGDGKVELRPFLSDPELMGAGDGSSHISVVTPGHDGGYRTLPSRGTGGSSLRLNQSSSISSYVTLRRATSAVGIKVGRPKSALERLYAVDPAQQQQRGKMSADEQLERMKRHQKALVRQRKRTLSHGDRHAASSSRTSSSRSLSADLGSWKREQEFDLQLLERAVQGEEAQGVRSVDLEPLDYDLDLNKELSKPQKVSIPERYVDSEPEEPLSPQEVEERHRKVERIKSILAKSSVQNLAPAVSAEKPEEVPVALDSALQEQERIITMSYALASEASLKSKLVAERGKQSFKNSGLMRWGVRCRVKQ